MNFSYGLLCTQVVKYIGKFLSGLNQTGLYNLEDESFSSGGGS
jgi:hypothetical protein